MQCLVVSAALVVAAVGSSPSTAPAPSTVVLSNGVKMPILAAGVWQYNDSVADDVVQKAIAAGFRHIDTAHDYNNQVGTGRGLKASGIKREDVFITSKVPGCGLQGLKSDNCEENTMSMIKEDIAQLSSSGYEANYIDLMLIHFPPCVMGDPTSTDSPSKSVCAVKRNSCSDPANCKAIGDQWRALSKAYSQGLLKAVGVSNYCSQCLACLGSNLTVKPMVNQAHMCVGMGPDPQGFRSTAKKMGMVLQAWSPLGMGGHGGSEILHGEVTSKVAKSTGKSTVQVALKWLISHDVAVATKSSNPKHLRENLDLFDWTLSSDDQSALDSATFSSHDSPSFMCTDEEPRLEVYA